MNAPASRRISFTAALVAALSSVAEVAQKGSMQFTELLAGARRFLQDVWQRPTKRRHGISALTASKQRGRRGDGPPRLGRARGPMSINAKADGLQLARMGRWKEAAEMLSFENPELAARYRRFNEQPDEVPNDVERAIRVFGSAEVFVP